jgi:tetraacyldisaccharide 4'-kinase
LIDRLFALVMRQRRRRALRRVDRKRLSCPVVSVGNLSVGGTGKTPVVAAIAQWLVERGEKPAVLSRGYRRASPRDGVVVVSDGGRILAGVHESGDEPLMLARAVPGAAVCVSADRHLAGVLAERALGCTVHVLDDGFQHVNLARDLDVLVTTLGEIPGGRVLPFGRLREPMDAAAHAHVLVVVGATAGAAASEAWTLGVSQHCGARRVVGSPLRVVAEFDSSSAGVAGAIGGDRLSPGMPVVLAAGIANPSRFADDVKAAGWTVAREVTFPDHHRYVRADIDRIAAAWRECGAAAVLTTDKDAVRFEPVGSWPFPLYRVPVALEFEPSSTLFDAVKAVLARRSAAEHCVPPAARSAVAS